MSPVDRNWKPHLEIAPDCPRCASPNTKFCYYNNYSLSQPRYFCKGCRRYWTKGGSLRNVPVGGGCRKTRRSSKSSRSAASRAPPPPPLENNHGGGDSSSSSTSNIDMAVVFANFLNPDLVSNSNSNSQSNSISSTPESGDQDGILFPPAAAGGSYEFFDLFREDGFMETAEIGGGAEQNQESMLNALGLQSLLGDEMAQLEASLWSTMAAGNDPARDAAAAWEPAQEQQGFEEAGDFGVANNWGCYDLQQLQGNFDISLQSLAKPPPNY
ncbi:unnamed protein product [Linum tenue]|uniref:Dof zinc finger protein n=1 Tax=Linum tenue TaxID=586396 RepID=A0AAV0RX86_9ROSI|nr:unnamed protein product [Linum tenue]